MKNWKAGKPLGLYTAVLSHYNAGQTGRATIVNSRPLNDDEQWLVDCCRLGRKADFTQRAGYSGELTEVSADLIRRLVLGQVSLSGSDMPVPLPLGLQVRGARIRGRLELADAGGSHNNGTCPPLVFEHCHFETDDPCPAPDQRAEPSVDLRHARCCRVSFVDCQLAMLALDDALIAGDLDLSGLRSSGGEGQQCWLRARGARVDGMVKLQRASLRLDQSAELSANESAQPEFACDLLGMVVQGDLIGSDGLTVFGGMALPRQVHGDIDLRGAALTCDRGPKAGGLALWGQSCEVGGVLLLRPYQRQHDILPFTCDGIVDFFGLKVGGSLDLSGGHFYGPDGKDADSAFRAYVAEVRGSVFMREWTPRANLPSSGAAWPTIMQGSNVDFRSALVGKSMYVAFHDGDRVAPLLCDGLCVGGVLHVEQLRTSCFLKAMHIGGDLKLSASVASDARPFVDVSDSTVGGNLWLKGHFEEVHAWSCNVQGQFGGDDYQTVQIVAPESRVQGLSFFRVSRSVDLRAAKLVANATILSISKVPGIVVHATSLCVDQDVIVEGPVRDLWMTMAVIGGHLRAKGSSVNEAKLDGARVRGNMELPRHIFGPVSFVGGRVEGAVLLHDVRLHVRRRPTGQTEPSIDFNDTQIEGDLKVEEFGRIPTTGVLEEVGEAPAWLDTVIKTLDDQAEALMLHRATSFYDDAQVIELHLPTDAEPDSDASCIKVECHAFLLLSDGNTVYLNGQSQPIHLLNDAKGGKSQLHLDSEEKALDYLRFFCGYVWGEEGAFVIIESAKSSDWVQYLERNEDLLTAAPSRPKARREGDYWVCRALVVYGDHLFDATFRITDGGMIEMEDDMPVARLKPQGVDYVKPYRRYWLATGKGKPSGDESLVHHTPHKVICDEGWQTVTDADARVAVIDRIRAELTETKKRQVALESEIRVLVDLRGCRCSSLEDDGGNAWGNKLIVDLRGFDYQDLAEGSSALRPKTNKLFAGTGALQSYFVGAELGRQRYIWLERVTRELDFSVSPYEQMVRVLARRGDPEAARTVLERRLHCENERQHWLPRWCILVGLQIPFRYGLFSKRGLWTVGLYWLLGTIAFDVANYGALRLPPVGAGGSQLIVGQIALPVRPVLVVDSLPVTMSVVSTLTGDKPMTFKVPISEDMTEEVSCGDQVEPSLYALDVMLPLVDLHQESKCTISSADGMGPLFWRIFRAAYALIGAYVTSMLILTLSGVLRRSTER